MKRKYKKGLRTIELVDDTSAYRQYKREGGNIFGFIGTTLGMMGAILLVIGLVGAFVKTPTNLNEWVITYGGLTYITYALISEIRKRCDK